jgi:hypothetical protein
MGFGGLRLLHLAMRFQVAFTDTALGGWINGMLGGLLAAGKTVLLLDGVDVEETYRRNIGA